ncbi:MAG: hypothetical protein AB2809_00985 [Candidatus Thiodiazotropha sp.]
MARCATTIQIEKQYAGFKVKLTLSGQSYTTYVKNASIHSSSRVATGPGSVIGAAKRLKTCGKSVIWMKAVVVLSMTYAVNAQEIMIATKC